MSVRMILLPVFVHVAFVFFLLFWGTRTRPNRDDHEIGWKRELELPLLYYVLTICAWHTQFADLLFLVLAWIFVALRLTGGIGFVSNATHLNFLVASAIVLAIMWAVYAARLLFILG